MTRYMSLLAVTLMLLKPASVHAAPITINFEALEEFASVGPAFPGLTILNATVLTAGSSLNELELPPHSGFNAVFDDGGPMSISFETAVFTIGGFFTYLAPLTLTAFDTNNNVLGSVSSLFANNMALSGDLGSTPNEFLEFISSTGIGSVSIAADLGGGSFALDDFRYDTAGPVSPAPVPEPATLLLFGAGAAALTAKRRRERQRRCG